jgi:hypothetical protein
MSYVLAHSVPRHFSEWRVRLIKQAKGGGPVMSTPAGHMSGSAVL